MALQFASAVQVRFEKGAITAEEFEKMKATLLGTGSSTQQRTLAAPAASSSDAPAGVCPQKETGDKDLGIMVASIAAQVTSAERDPRA